MKNRFFNMIIFCLISSVAYPMSINLDKTSVAYPMSIGLDETSRAKLIKKIKQENVERKYWPDDVTVRLEKFYKKSDTEYFVRAVGSYNGYVLVEYDSENKLLLPTRLGKGTEGCFSKEELRSLGVRLPE
jgi:hypothetical protein